jgi:predicted nucleotidyltransferase
MSLKDDIIKTIEYAKSYGCMLSKQQMIERLIGSTNYKLQIPRNKQAPNHKLQIAQKLAVKLSIKFPNILFIGVTGSVAAEFPKKNDDIDLFIIAKKDTLWITRFWVRIFVYLNKVPHRKFGRKEQKDEFCFNMWLDESALELPNNRQNLRNAVDMILMKKVYDKNNTYLKFIKINKWAKKFVATPYYAKTH